jgi:hypothetical protein
MCDKCEEISSDPVTKFRRVVVQKSDRLASETKA